MFPDVLPVEGTPGFGPTLLYIDVTNACPFGCRFCMYLEIQGNQHLELTGPRLAGLTRLAEGARLICISGEGEPLTQIERVLAVAGVAGAGQVVEVITSGGIPWQRFARFLDDFECLGAVRGFRPRVRLSFDRWHAEKVRHQNQVAAVQRLLTHPMPAQAAELRFRSVTTDLEWAPAALSALLSQQGVVHHWREQDALTRVLDVGGYRLPMAFKNLVQPDRVAQLDPLSLDRYIAAVECIAGRPFTFGNLQTDAALPGPDVTVKHDGSVLLYGLETERKWALDDRDLSRAAILDVIRTDPVLRTFYARPLSAVLRHLRTSPALAARVRAVNNPYWLVRTLRETQAQEFERALLHVLADEA